MPVKSFIILLMPAASVPASEVLFLAAEDFLLNAKAFLQETEAFLSQRAENATFRLVKEAYRQD